MQGRITKVLNMKPQEVSVPISSTYSQCFVQFVFQILSMVEEAAGTSMYESKRDQTNKLIEKKDAKLNEMDAVSNIINIQFYH